jgi:hypothetical protein
MIQRNCLCPGIAQTLTLALLDGRIVDARDGR